MLSPHRARATLVSSTQMPFYDNGVGADGTPLEKLTGGAFGLGIFQKIKYGYTKISQVYDADDEIFIFGFSRGAYTARQPRRHDCDLWPPYRKFR
jgi:uncharacterized protein (DUF2235 family)